MFKKNSIGKYSLQDDKVFIIMKGYSRVNLQYMLLLPGDTRTRDHNVRLLNISFLEFRRNFFAQGMLRILN